MEVVVGDLEIQGSESIRTPCIPARSLERLFAFESRRGSDPRNAHDLSRSNLFRRYAKKHSGLDAVLWRQGQPWFRPIQKWFS